MNWVLEFNEAAVTFANNEAKPNETPQERLMNFVLDAYCLGDIATTRWRTVHNDITPVSMAPGNDGHILLTTNFNDAIRVELGQLDMPRGVPAPAHAKGSLGYQMAIMAYMMNSYPDEDDELARATHVDIKAAPVPEAPGNALVLGTQCMRHRMSREYR